MGADWIVILCALGVCALGAFIGFGKGLRFLTKGLVGFAISIFICYCIGGLILDIDAIRNLLGDLAAKWEHISFLKIIHLEIIIYYIVLFLVAQVARILITRLVAKILEIKILPMKIINAVGGSLLFVALFMLILLLVFQIIYWIGGTTAANFGESLAGSWLGLDELFAHNPLIKMVDYINRAAHI